MPTQANVASRRSPISSSSPRSSRRPSFTRSGVRLPTRRRELRPSRPRCAPSLPPCCCNPKSMMTPRASIALCSRATNRTSTTGSASRARSLGAIGRARPRSNCGRCRRNECSPQPSTHYYGRSATRSNRARPRRRHGSWSAVITRRTASPMRVRSFESTTIGPRPRSTTP